MSFFPPPKFFIGDLLSVSLNGVLVGVACYVTIPANWNMFLAMFPGMAIGMLIPMITTLLVFARFFGAMEIMVPNMFGGMLAGMWVSMEVTMYPMKLSEAAIHGDLIGVGALFVCYCINAFEKSRANPR